MASTNKTTHYDLPQWIGTDKPTFLGDLNGAFSTIDTQLYTAVTNAENANDSATSAAGAVGDMQDDVNNLKTWQTTASSAISGLQNSVSGLTPTVSQVTNMFNSLGTLLQSFSPVITYSTLNERLITIDNLKLLNIYGTITFTYTGTPTVNDLVGHVDQIDLENIYTKYSIATNRSFLNIASMNFGSNGERPFVMLSLQNSGSKTQLVAQTWGTGNLDANGNVGIDFQALLVLN